MTTFTPDPIKIEHERLLMRFEEEYGCTGLRMRADEYRALLILSTMWTPAIARRSPMPGMSSH
jgi:hypothetical protein